MFPNIVICYEEVAIEVKTMAEGILIFDGQSEKVEKIFDHNTVA